MTTADMELVFTQILTDFINEHEYIGYDILSELNKFDQYISGQMNPVLPSECNNNNNNNNINENSENLKNLQTDSKESMNNDHIFLQYADYTFNNINQPLYKCKLCYDICEEFSTVDAFLIHIQSAHAKIIVEDHSNLESDRKCEQLWVGELEKVRNFNYQQQNEEFMKEIDEILGVQDFDLNAILNSLDFHDTSGIVFNNNNLPDLLTILPRDHSSSYLSSSTNSASPPNMVKKKKKRASGKCDVCNRTFNDLYNLRIHKMIHTGEKPFQCEECGKRFRQYNKLKIHCITHTNEKPYICDICFKGFRFRNYLSVHKRLHSGENPYKCKFCDEFFHSLHSRRLHTKMLHCEAKTFSCPVCEKVLTAQCYLTAHMKRHTNQRDYKCETCGKCFFSQSQLKDHQLVHTNLKPYQCNVCNARFQRKSNYTQHLKIHTGEKTYVCHICFKSFAQNAGLYGHMKSHAKC